jgi:hypothetical protein
MASNRKKNRQKVRRFNKKYERIIDETIKQYGERPWYEFQTACDKIKEDMRLEIVAKGLRM